MQVEFEFVAFGDPWARLPATTPMAPKASGFIVVLRSSLASFLCCAFGTSHSAAFPAIEVAKLNVPFPFT